MYIGGGEVSGDSIENTCWRSRVDVGEEPWLTSSVVGREEEPGRPCRGGTGKWYWRSCIDGGDG